MLSFLIRVFGLSVSFFRSSHFTFFLWSHLPILLNLVITFSVADTLLSLISLSFLILRSGLGGLGYLEVTILDFLDYHDQCCDFYCYV